MPVKSRWPAVVAPLLLASCASPELTNRYQNIAFPPLLSGTLERQASISVFTLAASDPPPVTTIASLSDRGQAEAVKALAAKEGSTKQLLSALATPLAPVATPAAFRDTTKMKRRIVVSIKNESLGPADRLAEATVILEPEQRARFLSWDKFKTLYENIDLGKLALSQVSGLTTGLTFGGIPNTTISGASLEGKYERNLNEEISLRQRIVTSTGGLLPERAEFYQQGAVGIDLTGNVIIDVSLDVVDDSIPLQLYGFSDLFDASGKPNSSTAVKVRSQRVVYPKSARSAITMDAKLNYMIRSVEAGDKSIAEGDDTTKYQRGVTEEQRAILVPAEEMQFLAWGLGINNRFIDVVQPSAGSLGALAIGSYDEAGQLLAWLKASQKSGGISRPVSVGGLDLFVGGAPMDPSAIGQLQVRIVTQNF